MTQYDKNAPETIQALFSQIAERYDRTNALMSFGMHALWNRSLTEAIRHESNGPVLLDLCCGTGEIALGYLKKAVTPYTAYLLDFCPAMLEVAKRKAHSLSGHNVIFLEGDAQQLPLESGSVNAVTIAYGIRNVQDPARCAREVYRVLQPGGIWGILELTRPTNPALKVLHQLYLKTCLPLLGKLSTSNKEAYAYLSSSIQSFLCPIRLQELLLAKGFSSVDRRPLLGGTATLLLARK